MKDTNGSEDWRVLCEVASKEQDPEKLIDLIVQINQMLEQSHQKSRYHEEANAYSFRSCASPSNMNRKSALRT